MAKLQGFTSQVNNLLTTHTFESLSETEQNQLFQIRNQLNTIQTCSHCNVKFCLQHTLGQCTCTNGKDHIDYCHQYKWQDTDFKIPVWILAFFKLYNTPFCNHIDNTLFSAKNKNKIVAISRTQQKYTLLP